MIDERTDEILSRYLDGDLDIEEVRRLTLRLEGEPGLREAFDEMRGLRQRLRRMALDERPPEVLDRMVRPLRRAGRPRRQRWAAAALVAAAAVVVVSVIVISETGRTGWMPWDRSADKNADQVFALSNLPTRDPDAPIGAIETLLAEENPEPEMVDPEALEVMGPLDRPPGFEESGLALKIGTMFVPVVVTSATAGLRVIVEVENGRVMSCNASGETEPTAALDNLCRDILSLEGLGLGDGRYVGVVSEPRDRDR